MWPCACENWRGTEIYLAHTQSQIDARWLSHIHVRIRGALSCAQQTDSTLKPQGGRYQANAQSHVEALKLNENNKISLFFNQDQFTRSQDLETTYHDSGQFYWFEIEKLLLNKSLFSENAMGVKVSEFQVQDIDSLEDWKMAEMKYKHILTN